MIAQMNVRIILALNILYIVNKGAGHPKSPSAGIGRQGELKLR